MYDDFVDSFICIIIILCKIKRKLSIVIGIKA